MKKENEVLVGGKSYEIKLVKMKYIKNGFYRNYTLLKEHGLIKIFKYSDGEEVLLNFLTSIYDSEEIAIEVSEDLTIKILNEILAITKKLNEIEDEPEIKNEITPD